MTMFLQDVPNALRKDARVAVQRFCSEMMGVEVHVAIERLLTPLMANILVLSRRLRAVEGGERDGNVVRCANCGGPLAMATPTGCRFCGAWNE